MTKIEIEINEDNKGHLQVRIEHENKDASPLEYAMGVAFKEAIDMAAEWAGNEQTQKFNISPN